MNAPSGAGCGKGCKNGFGYNGRVKQKNRKEIIALVLIAAGIAEMLLLKHCPDVFFPWYRNYSKQWISVLAFLFSFVPFSVWDIGALCIVLAALLMLIRTVIQRRSIGNLLRTLLLAVSVLLFSALQGWLGNHYAPKLCSSLNLEVKQYSVEELYETTAFYLLKAAEYAPQIRRDEAGHALKEDIFSLAITAGSSYKELAEEYPVFEGSSRPIKVFSLIGEYLLYNGIIGMFMPVTGEASVPANVPPVPMPFTMCHEAAHRLGIASEKEANFCAFLASTANPDSRFVYSGYYEGFSYCFSALYEADPERAKELYDRYDDTTGVRLVKLDRADTHRAYQKYDSPLQDISDEINDTYLKTFSQESGIRSYGEVTDYLIAWYLNHYSALHGRA